MPTIAITWTVSADGATWVAPATLGMQDVVFTQRRNGVDDLTWRAVCPYDSAPAWAYASAIYLRQTVTTDGTPVHTVRFVGRVEELPPQAAGRQEHISYKAVGPWWWFERITLCANWLKVDPVSHANIWVWEPRVILGMGSDGSPRTMGAEITADVNYASTRGVPIQLGTVDDLVVMPLNEQTNIKIADAIRSVLRLMPDVTGFFDYNTTATVGGVTAYVPTFHFRQASSLAPVSIALSDASATSTKLLPRYDIQLPGIRIVYESSFTVSGAARPMISVDTAGSTTDPRVVELLYELDGGSADYVSQDVEVEDYPSDPNDRAFWRAMLPWLDGIADSDLTITGASGDGALGLPSYFVQGMPYDWMGVQYEQETWTATIAYTRRDASGNVVAQVANRPVSAAVCSTDAATQRYTRLVSFTAMEPVPTGVAAAVYASWSRLHYDGRVRLEEQECTFQAGTRNLVNLTGGRAAWAAMADLVDEATYDLDNGTTDLTLGSGGRWEADSLVALYRAAHARRFAWHAPSIADPAVGSSAISGPDAASPRSADDGDPGEGRRLGIRASATEGGTVYNHTVDVNPAGIAHAASGDRASRTLQPREIRILEKQGDGTYKAKLAQVLCSSIYDAAGGDVVGGISITGMASGDMIQYNGSAWVKVTPSQLTFVVDVRVDATNKQLQKNTQTAYVVNPGSPSGWTPITGGTMVQGVRA